jgi:protein-L-isoaspartate(D-aspartate) O-methyltransferase
MLAVDRRHFLPPQSGAVAAGTLYHDVPHALHLGNGASLTSAHMHAIALEALGNSLLSPDCVRVLDVGCGTGYLTACMHAMMQQTKQQAKQVSLTGVDLAIDLVRQCDDAVRAALGDPAIEFKCANVLDLAAAAAAAAQEEQQQQLYYDVIHVGCGVADSTLVQALLALLRPGSGQLLVPEQRSGGSAEQDLVLYTAAAAAVPSSSRRRRRRP